MGTGQDVVEQSLNRGRTHGLGVVTTHRVHSYTRPQVLLERRAWTQDTADQRLSHTQLDLHVFDLSAQN